MAGNRIYGNKRWPKNLYVEMIEMMLLSDLIYTFSIILDTARSMKANGQNFVGIDVGSKKKLTRSGIRDSYLKRSFTPAEIRKLIQGNAKNLPFNGKELKRIIFVLERIQDRADKQVGMRRPITLDEFDDKFQQDECVYGITRDSINKRITVVFRGTDKLAFTSNWKSNLSMAMKKTTIPKLLKGKVKKSVVRFHTGFYNYLFNETKEIDAPGFTKYDAILKGVKSLLAKYPDHKVYTTGHSLGGALSTLAAFFFACETNLPKPVSCVNFASPRTGGSDFLDAVHYLERSKQLRFLRVNNNNDSIPTLPPGRYEHVGFQVTLYKKSWFGFGQASEPDVDYKKTVDSFWTTANRAWSNGFISNANIGYEHARTEYIANIELAKEHLEQYNLNMMYADERVVGYKLVERHLDNEQEWNCCGLTNMFQA